MRSRVPYLLLAVAVVALVGVTATLAVVVSSDDEPEALVVAPGLGQMGGDMMGSGMMGSGNVEPVESMADAMTRVDGWLEESGFDGLHAGEVMAFSNGYYAAVETGEGRGAFELLVDPATGWISPEPGPSMMWNTEYGMMQGRYGGGMMDGGMMGGSSTDDGDISAVRAREIADAWLADRFPGEAAEEPLAFPGYFTLDTERDGRPVGMLSVNARTGGVWYHDWHGSFIDELEAGA